MKRSKETAVKSKVKTIKVFKPLDKKQLEAVVGGPETSRGTETTVQHG
nr:bacteriocin [uncultured Flavobacterium sp.]